MLEIQVTNRAAFLSDLQKWSLGVGAGVSLGIQRAAAELAEDVASHVPVRSGKAQASVMMEMKNPMTALVGYAKDVTWYMKIVELSGAKAHPIIPRGRLGSADARKVGAYLRRHGAQLPSDRNTVLSHRQDNWLKISTASSSRSAEGKRSLLSVLRAAGVSASKIAALSGPGGSLTTAKRALTIGGGLFSWAPHHPGIKPKFILRTRLRATSETIKETVRKTLGERLHE